MKTIHIKEVWWTAGKHFRWIDKPTGIGLRLKDLQEHNKLTIFISSNPKPYFLLTSKALKYVKDHETIWTTKTGIKLGVIPLRLLDDEVELDLTGWLK